MTYTKFKPLVDFEATDTSVPSKRRDDDVENDNPMILPKSVWKNTVINFDGLLKEKRAVPRVPCYGPVVFYNRRGKIVALGDMRDLNEKSGGFEIMPVNLKVNDVLYLEFLKSPHFVLTQVRVVLRRIQLDYDRTKIGVEFVDLTPAFQDKLNVFLNEKRAEMDGFNEVEII